MPRQPLRFTPPHTLGCECAACLNESRRPPEHPPRQPRTPEDGQPVHTPEQGRGPFTREPADD